MTRQVYANAMVAHIWANQSQASARSHNGNYSFTDSTLFSYSTPIARVVPGVDGSDAYLITSHSYGITTQGKHIGPAHRAAKYKAFVVPNLLLGVTYVGRHTETSEDVHQAHEANLAHLVAQYEACKPQAKRTQNFAAHYLDSLGRLYTAAFDYAVLFGLFLPEIDVEADKTAILAYRAAREAKRNTPKAIAKRERDAAKREAIEAERQRLANASYEEKLAAWREGASVYLGCYTGWTQSEDGASSSSGRRTAVALRVHGDTVQTSLGATVPLDHAIRVFKAVKRCHDTGLGWQRNGHTIHVGHFQVDKIEPSGNFQAGCHYIAWPEVERLAKLIGVYDTVDAIEA